MEFSNIDWHSVAIYGIAICTMFATTFLRGFQNKNVAGGYIKLAGVVGYIMAVCDMITVGLIVKGGLPVAFVGAIGAGIGWMVGMHVHSIIMRKREKEREQAKKIKKRNRREDEILRVLEERLVELDLVVEKKNVASE